MQSVYTQNPFVKPHKLIEMRESIPNFLYDQYKHSHRCY
jgi:hypothetical protein